LVDDARQKFYCLNFVPNYQIPDFIKFIEDPQLICFKKIEYTMKTISRMNLYDFNQTLSDQKK